MLRLGHFFRSLTSPQNTVGVQSLITGVLLYESNDNKKISNE